MDLTPVVIAGGEDGYRKLVRNRHAGAYSCALRGIRLLVKGRVKDKILANITAEAAELKRKAERLLAGSRQAHRKAEILHRDVARFEDTTHDMEDELARRPGVRPKPHPNRRDG